MSMTMKCDVCVASGRQAYLMQLEGFSLANEIALKEKDALDTLVFQRQH